jgi:hypothetical protein
VAVSASIDNSLNPCEEKLHIFISGPTEFNSDCESFLLIAGYLASHITAFSNDQPLPNSAKAKDPMEN